MADKKKAKQQAQKGKQPAKGEAPQVSVSNHPRAAAQVRMAKGWGALIAAAVALYMSLQAGVPTFDAGLRAIGVGVAGYVIAWACAVTVWRMIIVAELNTLGDRRRERAEAAALAAVRKASAAQEGGTAPTP